MFFCFMYLCVFTVLLNAMVTLVFLNKFVIVLFWVMIGESGPDLVFLIRVLVCFLPYPLVEFLEQLLCYVGTFLLCVLSYIPFVFDLDLVKESAFC